MAAYIQKISDTSFTGSSSSVALTANTTIGNTVFAALSIGSARNLTSITDTKSNTWTVDVKTTGGGRNVAIARAYLTTALTSSDTLTVTLSGSATALVEVLEYQGVRSATFDVSVAGIAGLGTGPLSQTTAGSTTEVFELVLTAVATSVTETYTVPSGYTERPSTSLQVDVGEKYSTSLSTQTASWSWNNSGTSAVAVAAYKLKPSNFSELI